MYFVLWWSPLKDAGATLHLNCKKLEECQEIQATEKTEGLGDFMAVWTFRIKILNK